MHVPGIYKRRFASTGLENRDRVWRILCAHFFDDLIGPDKDVLDIACGYGEFINNVRARRKTAVDLNPDARAKLDPSIEFHNCSALQIDIPDSGQDVVFASNFLEHLPDRNALTTLFAEVHRVLRPDGRFIIMGPNIRYAYSQYWDFFDHYLPLSHLSLAEGLETNGFTVIRNIPRFLPYTMAGRKPTPSWMIKAYLQIRLAWHLFGKQFLLEARRAH
jgi:SAM-dependent methyltransferase